MENRFHRKVKRGDIFYADLGMRVGSEQTGTRPVLIIQNDVGNYHSPTVIVAVLTSKVNKNPLPTHVLIDARFGLTEPSLILFEQLLTIDRRRLRGYVGSIDDYVMAQAEKALRISLGLEEVCK